MRLANSMKLFYCKACDYQFTVTAGTVFNDSHLPHIKWLTATLLLCEARKGMSANQLKRTLSVTYKTAWYLCHRIRHAMAEVQPLEKLDGTVEVDETYVGGRQRGQRGRASKLDPKAKTPVVGVVSRKSGKVIARVAGDTSKPTLQGIIT